MISTETLYHSTLYHSLYHLNLSLKTQSMFVFHFLSQMTTVNFVTDPFWQNSQHFLDALTISDLLGAPKLMHV